MFNLLYYDLIVPFRDGAEVLIFAMTHIGSGIFTAITYVCILLGFMVQYELFRKGKRGVVRWLPFAIMLAALVVVHILAVFLPGSTMVLYIYANVLGMILGGALAELVTAVQNEKAERS